MSLIWDDLTHFLIAALIVLNTIRLFFDERKKAVETNREAVAQVIENNKDLRHRVDLLQEQVDELKPLQAEVKVLQAQNILLTEELAKCISSSNLTSS